MMALGGRNLEPAGINKKSPWFSEVFFLSLEAQTASSKSHTLPKLNMEAKMMLPVKFGSSPVPFGARFRWTMLNFRRSTWNPWLQYQTVRKAATFWRSENLLLGGWTNPPENMRKSKMGSSHPNRGEKQHLWHHHLVYFMTWNMTEWTDVTSHWVSTTHMRRSWEVTRIPKPERSACLEAFPYYSLPFGVTTRRFRRYNLSSLRTLFGHGCFHSIHFSDNTYEFSFPFGKHLWNKTHHEPVHQLQ